MIHGLYTNTVSPNKVNKCIHDFLDELDWMYINGKVVTMSILKMGKNKIAIHIIYAFDDMKDEE